MPDLRKILTSKQQELFKNRVQKGTETYKSTWRAIYYSKKAFQQVMPDDLEGVANNTQEDGDVVSRFVFPGQTFIGKKMMEDLTALPFRFETIGNNPMGHAGSRGVQHKLKQIYSRVGMMRKVVHNMYNFVVGGTSIVEPITYRDRYTQIKKVNSENKPWDLETDEMSSSRVIDIKTYDPMMTILDWNADPADIERTSRFIITAEGFYSQDEIAEMWSESVAEKVAEGGIVGDWKLFSEFENSELKTLKKNLQEMVGFKVDLVDSPGVYAYTKYFTGDGLVHEFIGGYYIGSNVVNNRIADRIPFVITPSFPHPDNPFGVTLWDYLKVAIQIASNAVNTIVDATEDNRSMPWVVDNELAMDGLTLEELKDRDFIGVSGGAGFEQLDLNKAIYKLESDEVTEGTRFMYSIGNEMMYLLAGSNPMEFGVQEKQLRTKGASEMMHSSMVRSDSDMSKKYESGMVNPLTWCIIRIMYSYYDDFGFDPEVIPKEALKNPEMIRVVPGSYLPEDRFTRIGRAVEVVKRSMSNPRSYELSEVEFDYLEALGVPDPHRLVKSGPEILREQLATAIARMSPDGQIPEKAQKLLDDLSKLAHNGEGKKNA